MTKKINETKVSDQRKFRNANSARVATRMTEDPNSEYRWVICETGYMGAEDEYERQDNFIEQGWDVVYSEERPADDRSNSLDNTTKNSDRLKPVTKRTRSGKLQVLMKCSKERREANETAKATRDEERRIASVKSIKRQGNKLKVTHGEYTPDE